MRKNSSPGTTSFRNIFPVFGNKCSSWKPAISSEFTTPDEILVAHFVEYMITQASEFNLILLHNTQLIHSNTDEFSLHFHRKADELTGRASSPY